VLNKETPNQNELIKKISTFEEGIYDKVGSYFAQRKK
jgi:hypothetical protein